MRFRSWLWCCLRFSGWFRRLRGLGRSCGCFALFGCFRLIGSKGGDSDVSGVFSSNTAPVVAEGKGSGSGKAECDSAWLLDWS